MNNATLAYRLGNLTTGTLFATFPELVGAYREVAEAGKPGTHVRAVWMSDGKQVGYTDMTREQSAELRAIRFAK